MKRQYILIFLFSFAVLWFIASCTATPAAGGGGNKSNGTSSSIQSSLPQMSLDSSLVYTPNVTVWFPQYQISGWQGQDIMAVGWDQNPATCYVSGDSNGLYITGITTKGWAPDLGGGFALYAIPDSSVGTKFDLSRVSNITFYIQSAEWYATNLSFSFAKPNNPSAADLDKYLTNYTAPGTISLSGWTTVTVPVAKLGVASAAELDIKFRMGTGPTGSLTLSNIVFVGYDGNPLNSKTLIPILP